MKKEEVMISRTSEYILALERVARAARKYEDIQTEAWHELESFIRELDSIPKPPRKDRICHVCKGNRFVLIEQKIGEGYVKNSDWCTACEGTGIENECPECGYEAGDILCEKHAIKQYGEVCPHCFHGQVQTDSRTWQTCSNCNGLGKILPDDEEKS